WRGEQHEAAGVEQGVAVADVAHFVDEGKQRSQPENDPEHSENRDKYTFADVTIELNHGSPPVRCDDSPFSGAAVPSTEVPGQSTRTMREPTTTPAPWAACLFQERRARQSGSSGTPYKAGSLAAT